MCCRTASKSGRLMLILRPLSRAGLVATDSSSSSSLRLALLPQIPTRAALVAPYPTALAANSSCCSRRFRCPGTALAASNSENPCSHRFMASLLANQRPVKSRPVGGTLQPQSLNQGQDSCPDCGSSHPEPRKQSQDRLTFPSCAQRHSEQQDGGWVDLQEASVSRHAAPGRKHSVIEERRRPNELLSKHRLVQRLRRPQLSSPTVPPKITEAPPCSATHNAQQAGQRSHDPIS
jgi:hypothetical protein